MATHQPRPVLLPGPRGRCRRPARCTAHSVVTFVMAAVVVVAAATLHTAQAFADGAMPINPRAPCDRCAPARLTWTSPRSCDRDVGGALPGAKTVAVDVAIQVELPLSYTRTSGGGAVGAPRPCVHVTARSSESPVWWFQMPPAAAHDHTVVVCPDDGDVAIDAASSATRTSNTYTVRGVVHVPVGFTRLAAWLHESELVAPEAVVVVAAGDHGLTDGKLRRAFDSARAMEHDDNQPVRELYNGHSQQYKRDAMLHPELDVGSHEELLALLHPDLAAALRDGSPQALMEVVRGSDHVSRCRLSDGQCPGVEANGAPQGVYTIPMFAPDVAAKLVEELDNVKQSPVGPHLSVPNNSGKPRDHRTGVVLPEVGLGALAEALAGDVLAPFARLLHKAWTPWHLDSYHAFSIHVMKSDSGAFKAERTEPVSNRNVGDRLPRHVDVCESSLNVCLGNPGFNGSDVYFQNVMGTQSADALGDAFESAEPESLAYVRHVQGRAFINLCQHFHGTNSLSAGERHTIVVRGLSSHFRRAPAELFTSQCLA